MQNKIKLGIYICVPDIMDCVLEIKVTKGPKLFPAFS